MNQLVLLLCIAVGTVYCYNQSCNTIGRIHSKSKFYLMVDSCHSYITTSDKIKCENESNALTSESLPVIDNDGVLYKNVFCARCNNVLRYHYPNINAECFYTDEKLDICSPIIQNKRHCACAIESIHCNLAADYMTGIKFYYLGSMQIFCGLLDESFKIDKSCDFTSGYIPASFSQLITITWNPSFDGYANPSSATRCSSSQIYSIISRKCKDINCQHGYVLDNKNDCVKNTKLPSSSFDFDNSNKNRTIDYGVFLILTGHRNTINNDSKTVKNLECDFHTFIETFSVLYTDFNKTVLQRSKNDLKHIFLKCFLRHFKKLEILNNVKHIVITQLPNQLITKQYGFGPSRTFSQNRLCARRLVQQNFTNDFSNQDIDVSALLDNHLFDSNVTRWITFQRNGEVLQYTSTCLSYHLNSDCKTERIEKNYILNENNTLTLVTYGKKNIILNEDQYLPTNTGYLICIKESIAEPNRIHHWKKVIEETEAYISSIASFASIILELNSILLFLLLKKLQNGGGLNLLLMIFFLFLSDILFAISNKFFHSTIQSCKWIAVVLHWASLTLSMWGIIIVYDLSRDITRGPRNQTASKSFKKFSFMMKRTAVSLIAPTFIIALSIALNELELFRVGYGQMSICWINSFLALVTLYIAPVVLSYLFSFVRLTLILRYIMKERKFIQENSKGNIKQKGKSNQDCNKDHSHSWSYRNVWNNSNTTKESFKRGLDIQFSFQDAVCYFTQSQRMHYLLYLFC